MGRPFCDLKTLLTNKGFFVSGALAGCTVIMHRSAVLCLQFPGSPVVVCFMLPSRLLLLITEVYGIRKHTTDVWGRGKNSWEPGIC